MRIQQALIDVQQITGNTYDLGSTGPNGHGVDGIYGPKTAAAVKKFKADEKLGFTQFGDVGPGTMHRLDVLFSASGTGAGVGTDGGGGSGDAPGNCTPMAGLSPTDCSAYKDNEFWLPGAYVNNATCACEQTPNSTTANCVRKFLQQRLKEAPQSVKDFWAAEKQVEFFNKGEYDNDLLQFGLTQRIFQDHVDAYSNCCCPSGPAPFTAWIGVTTVKLSCDIIGEAIRQVGSCHGTRGAW
jgi:hypothetical protein